MVTEVRTEQDYWARHRQSIDEANKLNLEEIKALFKAGNRDLIAPESAGGLVTARTMQEAATDPWATTREAAASMGARTQTPKWEPGYYQYEDGKTPVLLSDGELVEAAVAKQEQGEFRLAGIPLLDVAGGGLIGFISSEVIDGIVLPFTDATGNPSNTRVDGGGINWLNPGMKAAAAVVLAAHRRLIGMQIVPRQMALFAAVPLVVTAIATVLPLDSIIQNLVDVFSGSNRMSNRQRNAPTSARPATRTNVTNIAPYQQRTASKTGF